MDTINNDKDMMNRPCKDLFGEISFVDMFRPVKTNNTITDSYGYVWKQVTSGGWSRETDNFFIPMGPNGQYYIHEQHSVEAIKAYNKYMETQ